MIERLKEKLAVKAAWLMPRRLAYWCAIRLGAHATQGQWGSESPTDLLMMDALKRWEGDAV